MNKRQNQRVDQLSRIKQYVQTHAIEPAIPRATELVTEANSLHEGMLAHGSGQEGGGNTYRSGASQRRALRDEILFTVTEISDTASKLDPAQHPGIRDLFRLNRARDSYQRLLNTGASFVEHLESAPVKTLFTDRGFDAGFDVDLTAKLVAFAGATRIKWNGRQAQKTGTVGLEELNRRAALVVRELSAIMVKHLRKTDPLQVPVWKAAARAYGPAVSDPQAPPGGSGDGSGSTPPAGS